MRGFFEYDDDPVENQLGAPLMPQPFQQTSAPRYTTPPVAEPPQKSKYTQPMETERLQQAIQRDDPKAEEAAHLYDLARRSGVPVEWVKENKDEVEHALAQKTFTPETFRQNSPALAQWVASDRFHAALTQDDITPLSAWERTWKTTEYLTRRPIGGLYGGIFEWFWGALEQGAQFAAEDTSPGNASRTIPFGGGMPVAEHEDNSAMKWLGEFSRQMRLATQATTGDIEGPVPNQASRSVVVIGSGLESIGRMAPTAVIGLMGGWAPGIAAIGLQTSASSYGQARDEGMDVRTSMLFSALEGGLEALTEAIPEKYLLGDVMKKSPLWRSLLHQIVPETLGEQLATASQDFVEWAFLPSNTDKTFQDYMQARPQAAMDTLLAVMTTIGGHTLLTHATAKGLEKAGVILQNSKTFQRAPEKLREFLGFATQDDRPVLVPTDFVTQYFTAKGIDPAVVIGDLTGNPNAYKEAVERGEGSLISIPVADYLAKIATSEHAAPFLDEVKRDPAALSLRELKEAKAKTAEALDQMQEAIDKALHGKDTAAERESPLRQAISATILRDPGFNAMTTRAGVEADEAANLYAAGVEAVVTSLGIRGNENPFDILARHNIHIGNEALQAAVDAIQQAHSEHGEPEDGVVAPSDGEAVAAAQQAGAAATGEPVPAPAAAATPGEGATTKLAADGSPALTQDVPTGDDVVLPQITIRPPNDDTFFQHAPGKKKKKLVPAKKSVSPHDALALAPARVVNGRLEMSARVPSGAESEPASGVLRADVSALYSATSDIVKRHADILRAGWVTLKEAKLGDKQVIEAFIARAQRNLVWLYNNYGKTLRERAKRWYVGAHRIAQNLSHVYNISLEQSSGVLAVLSPQKDWFQNVSMAHRVIQQYFYALKHNPVWDEQMMLEFHTSTAEGNMEYAKGVKPDQREAYMQRKVAELKADLASVQGRAFSDLTLRQQAWMLRMLDERTSRSYRVILPEGEEGDWARKQDGSHASVAWGEYDPVEHCIAILTDGTVETIHERLGMKHKVRSFYNNIVNPWNPNFVTIDTHAVAAAMIMPLGGGHPLVHEVMSGPSDKKIGIYGLNPIVAEAYFRLADELGMDPRELQSITWEAVRGLFRPEQKKSQSNLPSDVARLWDLVKKGKIAEEEYRAKILQSAGGIARPDWADTEPRLAYDEGRIRQGDVLPDGPGLPAGRRVSGEDSRGFAGRRPALVDGPVVPNPVIQAINAERDRDERQPEVTRVLGQLSDAKARAFESRRHPDDPRARRLGNTFTPDGRFKAALAASGYAAPVIHQLPSLPESAADFAKRINASRAANKWFASVFVYPTNQYRGMRLFLTESGDSGFALKPDGDIVSVFSAGGSGNIHSLIALAVQLGGTKLDCFDTILPDLYSVNGFKVVQRFPWDDSQKPDGWDYAQYAKFKNGRPDVVFMQYDPVSFKTGPITLYQGPQETPTQARWAVSRMQQSVMGAQQEIATGAQWKAMIRNSKIGVNADEFLVTHVDDLEDKKKYSRADVLAYLRQNEVGVTFNVMGELKYTQEQLRAKADELWEDRVRERVEHLLDARANGYGEGRYVTVEELDNGEFFLEDQDGNHLDDHAESYATREEAEAQAEIIQQEFDKDTEEEAREQVRRGLHYDDFLEEAKGELENDAMREGKTVQAGQYSLDENDTAEPGSYREVFIQAATGDWTVGFRGLTRDENLKFRDLVDDPKKGVNFHRMLRIALRAATMSAPSKADAPAARKATLEEMRTEMQVRVEKGQHIAEAAEMIDLLGKILAAGGDYDYHHAQWDDGHGFYEGIENPIVRLRYNVRTTVADPVAAVNDDVEQRYRALADVITEAQRKLLTTDMSYRAETDLRDRIKRNIVTLQGLEKQRRQEFKSQSDKRILFLEEVQPPHEDQQQKMPAIFVKHWREIAFKWAIRQAAEQGLDGVAWTNGEQQAERYSLRKHVDGVEWYPVDKADRAIARTAPYDSIRRLRMHMKGGRHYEAYVIDVDQDGIVRGGTVTSAFDEPLAKVIGKEMAAQLLGMTAERGQLGAIDLEFGGDGLMKLYDKDYPAVVNSLPVVKKNGGKVTTTYIFRGAKTTPSQQPFLPLTPAITAAALGGQTLFQDDEGEKRGAITFGANGVRVGFLKNADTSTFLHEMGHLYLHILNDMTSKIRVGDPATWTAGQRGLINDHDTILKWLGVASVSQIGVEQHEQFARGFEAYLMRGIAPTPQLAPAFARYRSWLTTVYRSMTDLRVQLSDDIIGVFDRMVASDDAITIAEKQAALDPIFAKPEDVADIMTAIEFQGYRKLIESAHEQAKTQLQTRLMNELTRQRSKWWKAEKQSVSTEAEQRLRQQPVYRALQYLAHGQDVTGEKAAEHVKLSKASIVEQFGEGMLTRLPKPYVYQVDDGIDVKVAAEMFGFTSAHEMLEALVQATPLKNAVATITQQEMTKRYGDMRQDGTIQIAAKAAVENDGYEFVLQQELRALAKKAREVAPIVRAAKRQESEEDQSARRALRAALQASELPQHVLDELAGQRIGTQRVRDLTPSIYWSEARSQATKAAQAFAAGNYEASLTAKQAQRLNLALHKATLAAIERADAMQKYVQRLQSSAAQQRLGKAGESYREQVNYLLGQYSFAKESRKALTRKESLVKWVEARQAEGLPLDIDAATVDAAYKQNYKSLPVAQLDALYDTLKQIEHIARLKNELLTNTKRRDFQEARDELVASMLKHNALRASPLEIRNKERRKLSIENWFASHAKLSTLVQQLDGFVDNGPAWNLLLRPLTHAADMEVDRQGKDASKLNEILTKYFSGKELAHFSDKLFIPAIGNSMSKEGRLAMALNWGNETSRDRIRSDKSLKFTEGQIHAVLETLDKRDWDFVQSVWDFVNGYWQEISDKQQRLTGVRPEKVEAVPVETRFGRYNGGYYPLVYDTRKSGDASARSVVTDAKQQMAGAYLRQTTKRGHTQARVEHLDESVRLHLDVLFKHVDQVVHDLTHHEALIDVSKMLRDSDVHDTIHAVGGPAMYAQFTDALTDIAAGRTQGRHMSDGAVSWMKTGSQVAGLGFNLWTAAQQPLGLFNGAARIGPTWMLKGFTRFTRDASSMENTLKWINSVSPFMASRAITQSQDIHDLHAAVSQPGGWFDGLTRQVTNGQYTKQDMADAFVWHIGLMQRVADIPTWLGMYEKAKATMNASDEDAVALADLAVRDSQGGGQLVDLASVQRGPKIAQLFMTFYSYGNTVYNQTLRSYKEHGFKDLTHATKFLGDLSLIYLFPAVGTILLSRLLRGGGADDDDDAVWSFTKDVGTEIGASALNTMILVRELGGLLKSAERGYQGPAGTRVFQSIYGTAQQIAQGDVDEGMWKSLNQLSGIVFRYPAVQVQKTVDGIVALEEGRTHNPAAVFFGPPEKKK